MFHTALLWTYKNIDTLVSQFTCEVLGHFLACEAVNQGGIFDISEAYLDARWRSWYHPLWGIHQFLLCVGLVLSRSTPSKLFSRLCWLPVTYCLPNWIGSQHYQKVGRRSANLVRSIRLCGQLVVDPMVEDLLECSQLLYAQWFSRRCTRGWTGNLLHTMLTWWDWLHDMLNRRHLRVPNLLGTGSWPCLQIKLHPPCCSQLRPPKKFVTHSVQRGQSGWPSVHHQHSAQWQHRQSECHQRTPYQHLELKPLEQRHQVIGHRQSVSSSWKKTRIFVQGHSNWWTCTRINSTSWWWVKQTPTKCLHLNCNHIIKNVHRIYHSSGISFTMKSRSFWTRASSSSSPSCSSSSGSSNISHSFATFLSLTGTGTGWFLSKKFGIISVCSPGSSDLGTNLMWLWKFRLRGSLHAFVWLVKNKGKYYLIIGHLNVIIFYAIIIQTVQHCSKSCWLSSIVQYFNWHIEFLKANAYMLTVCSMPVPKVRIASSLCCCETGSLFVVAAEIVVFCEILSPPTAPSSSSRMGSSSPSSRPHAWNLSSALIAGSFCGSGLQLIQCGQKCEN